LVTLLFEESSSEHNSRRPAPAPLARVPGAEGGTDHSARPWKDYAVTHLKWAAILHQSRPGVQFFRFCYYPKSREEENAFPAGTPCDANCVRFPYLCVARTSAKIEFVTKTSGKGHIEIRCDGFQGW